MKTIHFKVSEKDIEGYAALSGDFNPIHFDQEYAAAHGFAHTIAHGMLTMAKVWSVVANELGLGPRHIQYSLSFQAPVYAGAQVELTIIEKEQTIFITGKSKGTTVVKGHIKIE
ncbi:MaoC family dehydratase [Bacillus benzoevorans]|uniref:3-hydroxybutyryl-CoA dehydratase n=1 Tax=Bacillus benzoevorans TaxID=1456 RepID=A0A7X0HUS0_9BACI|nr:MaoC/PaaZ C-terminal domain-containing protein [Bacillus benzoevorans]MBB6447219.1 3-hydroxybutyryl-CoA dehydratase [Bacillus benzoevorans]